MKVKLVGRPTFYFPMQLELLRLLMKCSKIHYDGECQRASAAAGSPLRPGSSVANPKNGILVIWRNRFVSNDACDWADVNASWDDLDLVTKICEVSQYLDSHDDVAKVRAFRMQIGRVLLQAGDIAKSWEREISV